MELGVLQGCPDEIWCLNHGWKTTILPFMETGNCSVASKTPSGVSKEPACLWRADWGVRPLGTMSLPLSGCIIVGEYLPSYAGASFLPQ